MRNRTLRGFRRIGQHEVGGVSHQTLPRAEHPRGLAKSNDEGEGGNTGNPSTAGLALAT